MNREIKFRAWDGKKIHTSYAVARPQFADVLSIMTDKDFAKKQYGLNMWEVMQYTGLKDYYEGDIHELKLNGTETHIEYQSAEIKWHNKACGFAYFVAEKGSDYNWIGLNDKNILKRKSLGNIYENPKLLTNEAT